MADDKSKSRSEIEQTVSSLQDQLKKITINNGKKLYGNILKYISRNMYLKISRVVSGGSIFISYLYYMDKDYIRKYKNINLGGSNNSFGNKDININTKNGFIITKPICSNIVPLGNFTYLYYNMGPNSNGDYTVSIYFIGRDMYKARKDMVDFCNDYRKFIIKRRKNTPITSITVRIYKDINTSSDRRTIPIKNDRDVISKNKDEIISSIIKWSSKPVAQWYIDHNIIHKYGALLYGPPGTGKTSLISHIATVLRRDIYTMDLSFKLEDLKAVNKSQDIINSTIIVIEDIDISLNLKNKSDAQKQEIENKIQWLMQVLDGTESIENSIIIITTNKIEDIDERLLRKGRIDKKIEVGYFDRDEMKQMCDYFGVDMDAVVDSNLPIIQPVELQSLIREHLFTTIQEDL